MAKKPDKQDPAASAYYSGFRDRLVLLREELDWSQAQMAKALGVPLANYKKYEIRSKFPLHKIELLALVTHETVEYVVTGNGRSTRLRVVR